jgi:hypothetical protein
MSCTAAAIAPLLHRNSGDCGTGDATAANASWVIKDVPSFPFELDLKLAFLHVLQKVNGITEEASSYVCPELVKGLSRTVALVSAVGI